MVPSQRMPMITAIVTATATVAVTAAATVTATVIVIVTGIANTDVRSTTRRKTGFYLGIDAPYGNLIAWSGSRRGLAQDER